MADSIKLILGIAGRSMQAVGSGLSSQHKGTVRYLLPVTTLTRFFGWRTIRPTVVK